MKRLIAGLLALFIPSFAFAQASFHASEYAESASASSQAITLTGPDVSAGDIAFIYTIAGGPALVTGISPGSWVLVDSVTVAATGTTYVYVNTAPAATTYTITYDMTVSVSATAFTYSGASTTTPIDVHATNTEVGATTGVCPSLTTSGTNEQYVCSVVSFATNTFPGSMTVRYSNLGFGVAFIDGADETIPTAGATGVRNVTHAASNSGEIAFAINQASATATPTITSTSTPTRTPTSTPTLTPTRTATSTPTATTNPSNTPGLCGPKPPVQADILQFPNSSCRQNPSGPTSGKCSIYILNSVPVMDCPGAALKKFTITNWP